jgi:hypothetical protein
MEPPRADGALRLLVRLLLVVAALLLLWLSDQRLYALRDEFGVSFLFPVVSWLVYVLLAALAGFAFALALVLPSRFDGYRGIRVLVLSLPPLVLLVVGVIVPTRDVIEVAPEFVLRLSLLFGGAIQGVAAVMLGAVLGAGFAERPVFRPG